MARGNTIAEISTAKKYTPRTELIERNYGNGFYAGQAFSNAPDGHCIEVGWGLMEFEPIPGMPFNQQMTFPVELTLRTTEEGPRLFTNPVNGIGLIHGKEHTWADEQLQTGQNLLTRLNGELFDIEAEFEVGEATDFGFVIFGVPVVYDVEEGRLMSGDLKAPLKPQDGKIRIRLLVDRLSVEVFANDGRIYMPIRTLHLNHERGIEVFTKGAETTASSLDVRELKSIWN